MFFHSENFVVFSAKLQQQQQRRKRNGAKKSAKLQLEQIETEKNYAKLQQIEKKSAKLQQSPRKL